MDLDHAIDQARRDKGYSWSDLARHVGVHDNTLLNIRRARTEPRAEHIDALEDALGWNRGQYWLLRDGGTPHPSPTDTPETALEQAIEQARRAKGYNKTTVARLAGVDRKTFYTMTKGQAGPKAAAALERVLGWDPGQYATTRDTGELPPEHTPPLTLSPGEQLRMVGHTDTEHGTLTWIEHPGRLRDYTLAREIGGQERGVSIKGSSLSPAEAAEDLAVGLSLMEQLLNAQHNPGDL